MTPRTTIGKRKKILSLHAQGRSKRVIMDATGCSYYQVWNVINGRVKTNYSPRMDKGTKRSSYVKRGNDGKINIDPRQMVQLDNEHEFLRYNLMIAYKDLHRTKASARDRIKMLKDAAWIELRIKQMELEAHIKRPDAALIARVMRRFDPKLTDDDVIRIYREEHEKLVAETANV